MSVTLTCDCGDVVVVEDPKLEAQEGSEIDVLCLRCLVKAVEARRADPS